MSTHKRVSQSRGGNHRFPFKLYELIEAVATSTESSIVSWNPGGRSFTIHDTDQLMEQVVPRYFRQTKFRSFVSPSRHTRQLNMWGFVNLHDGGWKHEHFIRGNPDALHSIVRIDALKKSPRDLEDNDDDPGDEEDARRQTASSNSARQPSTREESERGVSDVSPSSTLSSSRDSSSIAQSKRPGDDDPLPSVNQSTAADDNSGGGSPGLRPNEQADSDDTLLRMSKCIATHDCLPGCCRCSFCLRQHDSPP
ncbi:hypothetical protein ACHAWF_010857 [Thalassiosira exigua]